MSPSSCSLFALQRCIYSRCEDEEDRGRGVRCAWLGGCDGCRSRPAPLRRRAKREFFIDNVLVRIHFIIEMIWWTDLAPWEFESFFSGSLVSAFRRSNVTCKTVKARFWPRGGWRGGECLLRLVGRMRRLSVTPPPPGDTSPCRMTAVTLHSHVRYKAIEVRTCCGPLFSSVKPYSHTMSVCVHGVVSPAPRLSAIERI